MNPIQQIGEIDGGTVTNSDEPQLLPTSLADGPLAEIVVSGCKKFRNIIPYVIELRKRFASQIRSNADIAGCNTWTEFCEKHLDRTTSAVQKAIAVHTSPELRASKHCLPVNPVERFADPTEPAGNPEPEKPQPRPKPAPVEPEVPTVDPAPEPTAHNAVGPVACVCPKCKKTFESRSQLKKHGVRDHGISSDDIASFVNGTEPAKYQENPFELTALFFGMDVHVKSVSPEQPGYERNFHVTIRNRTTEQVRALVEILDHHRARVGIGTPMPGADKND